LVSQNIKERVLEVAAYFVEEKSTIRATAEHFGLSRNMVFNDLRYRLPQIDPELAKQVAQILDHNWTMCPLRGSAASKKARAERK